MSNRARGILVGTAFLTMAAATAQAGPSIGVNFTGVTLSDTFALGTAAAPPDTMGAIGPNHFAEFVNGAFAVYDKSSGTLIGSKIGDKTFWTNAGIASTALSAGISDPRIYYDPTSSRWFASQITVNATGNSVLLARSDSTDPSSTWHATSFNGGGSQFLDYDTLGVNGDGVMIGGNTFTSSTGSYNGTSFFTVPKASLLLASPTTTGITRFDSPNVAANLGFTPQAANGSTVGHDAVLTTDGSNRVQITRVSNEAVAGGATLSSPTVLTSAFSTPPQIHQPDGTQQIDPVDARLTGAVKQVGNYLYGAHAVANPANTNFSAIHWFKIDETTNALVAQGTLADPTGHFDYFQPSIAVSSTGNVVLGFDRGGDSTTGTAGNLSSYAFVGTDTGSAITFGSTPLLLKQGIVSNYHLFGGAGERWGDYSATWADPSDPNSFWTIQEYPEAKVGGQDRWATEITQILVPEPASAGLLAVGAVTMLARRRRQA